MHHKNWFLRWRTSAVLRSHHNSEPRERAEDWITCLQRPELSLYVRDSLFRGWWVVGVCGLDHRLTACSRLLASVSWRGESDSTCKCIPRDPAALTPSPPPLPPLAPHPFRGCISAIMALLTSCASPEGCDSRQGEVRQLTSFSVSPVSQLSEDGYLHSQGDRVYFFLRPDWTQTWTNSV